MLVGGTFCGPAVGGLLGGFVDVGPWLLVGIPSRVPFFVTRYLERHSVKQLMSLREGLRVMMQCYMRQHFADRYWLHEHPGGDMYRGENLR